MVLPELTYAECGEKGKLLKMMAADHGIRKYH